MKKLSEYLKDMRDLLSDEKRWIQGSFGRDEKGPIDYHAPKFVEATCFCIIGAAVKVTCPNASDCAWALTSGALGRQLVTVLSTEIPKGYPSLWWWNDEGWRKHSEVLELLDRTIKKQVALEAAGVVNPSISTTLAVVETAAKNLMIGMG